MPGCLLLFDDVLLSYDLCFERIYDIIGFNHTGSILDLNSPAVIEPRYADLDAIMVLDLKNAHKQFVEYLTSRRRAHATIVAYSKDIEQIVTFLTNAGKKDTATVTREELEAFLKKLAADSYTPKSISRKINSMKTFYRFLKTSGTITVDPASDIEHPK